jgi:L-lysine exporter family protein LysE/ArgO
MIGAGLQGFIIGLGLIIAIGAQNIFVLKAGLQQRHIFWVAAISALCDTALIIAGAGGLGSLIASNDALRLIARYGGAAFVIGFGLWSLWSAYRPKQNAFSEAEAQNNDRGGRNAMIAASFAFALLNPHVYVDTVLLLGGIGAQFDGSARLAFVIGASIGSILWFFGLGYGARYLLSLFKRPMTARLFDLFVAAVMFFVGASLLI